MNQFFPDRVIQEVKIGTIGQWWPILIKEGSTATTPLLEQLMNVLLHHILSANRRLAGSTSRMYRDRSAGPFSTTSGVTRFNRPSKTLWGNFRFVSGHLLIGLSTIHCPYSIVFAIVEYGWHIDGILTPPFILPQSLHYLHLRTNLWNDKTMQQERVEEATRLWLP